jgi:hypothetical protein
MLEVFFQLLYLVSSVVLRERGVENCFSDHVIRKGTDKSILAIMWLEKLLSYVLMTMI